MSSGFRRHLNKFNFIGCNCSNCHWWVTLLIYTDSAISIHFIYITYVYFTLITFTQMKNNKSWTNVGSKTVMHVCRSNVANSRSTSQPKTFSRISLRETGNKKKALCSHVMISLFNVECSNDFITIEHFRNQRKCWSNVKCFNKLSTTFNTFDSVNCLNKGWMLKSFKDFEEAFERAKCHTQSKNTNFFV